MTNLKQCKVVILTFTMLLICTLPLQSVRAGDEDMMNPYTEFDPETGFFIPIDPSTRHQQVQGDDVAEAAIPEAKPLVSVSIEEGEITETDESDNQALLLLTAVALLLVGGFIWFRKSGVRTG